MSCELEYSVVHSYELRRHRWKLWSKQGRRPHLWIDPGIQLPDTLLGRFWRGKSGDERRISWIEFPSITPMQPAAHNVLCGQRISLSIQTDDSLRNFEIVS